MVDDQVRKRAQTRLDGLLRNLTTTTHLQLHSTNSTQPHKPDDESGLLNLPIGHLSIADVTLPVYQPNSLPPRFSTSSTHLITQDHFSLAHLRWLAQKTQLDQDCCLLAPAASCSYTRQLALGFCALAQREYEYVAVNRDLGESDLKQDRRISGSGKEDNLKTLKFVDSATLRAVKLGRVLILDGIEKAERGIVKCEGSC